MKRVFYITLAIYTVLYFTVFNFYIYPNYRYSQFFWCIAWLPLLILPVVMCYPKAYDLLGKLVKLKAWIIASILLMVTCSTLYMLGITPIWGSFTSMGLTFASLVLALCLMDGRVEKGKSLLIGIGLVWVTEGILEVIYKTGWISFYSFVYPQGYRGYITDMIFVVMWLFVGWLTLHIASKNIKALHITTEFKLLALLGVGMTAMWYLTGFHESAVPWNTRYSNGIIADIPINRIWRAAVTLAPIMLLVVRERRSSEQSKRIPDHSGMAAIKYSHNNIPGSNIHDE